MKAPTATPEQESHISHLTSVFERLMTEKYRAGVQEHGDSVWTLEIETLINHAIEEAIDQVVYLLTIKDKFAATKYNNHDEFQRMVAEEVKIAQALDPNASENDAHQRATDAVRRNRPRFA